MIDKNLLAEAATSAVKSRDVAAPAVGVMASGATMIKGETLSFLSQAEGVLTVIVLVLSALWLVVQMWSRIVTTLRIVAKKEGNEA